MKRKQLTFQDSDAEFFTDVVFMVEADSFAQLKLWQENEASKRVTWKEVTAGNLVRVGLLDGRPVNIDIGWAFLNGKRVMFWTAVSQVVDHVMIDAWFERFGGHILWDGTRPAHCDAMNFHHCLRAIGAIS